MTRAVPKRDLKTLRFFELCPASPWPANVYWDSLVAWVGFENEAELQQILGALGHAGAVAPGKENVSLGFLSVDDFQVYATVVRRPAVPGLRPYVDFVLWLDTLPSGATRAEFNRARRVEALFEQHGIDASRRVRWEPQKSGRLKDGVVAILQDEAGRYLFIRRGLKLKRAPGWWCFVGGEVEAGESQPEAMAREMREEVGLRVTVHDKVHESVSPNGEYLLHWFVTRLDPPGQEPVPSPEEVAELRWLSGAEGLRLDPILPGLRAWLEQQAKGCEK